MKRLVLLCALGLLSAACASQPPHCRGRLTPINRARTGPSPVIARRDIGRRAAAVNP